LVAVWLTTPATYRMNEVGRNTLVTRAARS